MALQNNNTLPSENFIAGETRTLVFLFKDKNTGLPLDLSMFEPSLKVCPLSDKNYTILEKNGTLNSDPKTGMCEFILNTADTEDWDEGYYLFQAIVTQRGTEHKYKAEGNWYVKGAIR